MKKGIVVFSILLGTVAYAQVNKDISISEVMFYPLEENGEFVEIFNNSNFSVDIEKYKIVYHTSKADTIIEFNSGTILKPKHFAVIFENDYNSANGVYTNLVTDSTLVLQIDNGKFGSSGMANNSNRTIRLLDAIGDTIDTYTYSVKNKIGFSDEKINPSEPNTKENWSNSIAQHGTPGFRNSVSQREYDLTISAFSITHKNIFVGSETEFTLQIKNLGSKDASNFGVELFIDYNKDSVAQSEEILFNVTEPLLHSNDSSSIAISKTFDRNGSFNLFAEVLYSLDERTENNYISKQILVRPKPNIKSDIVITEIMYKPTGDEPEWIEIYNRTQDKINLNDWRVVDRTSKPRIADSTYFIEANSYLVLSEDETIQDYYKTSFDFLLVNLPSLNNTGDDLRIIDSLQQTIDSVSYNSTWGGKNGNSLEKISPNLFANDSSNWRTSISENHATPGIINSVTKKENDLAIEEIGVSNDYAIIGEDYKIKIITRNIGLTAISNFEIKIYHDENLDSTPQIEELSKDITGSYLDVNDSLIYFETLTDFLEGKNNYIVQIITERDNNYENNESIISFTGVLLNEIRNDIVINEIMYAPKTKEPEWIEILNQSSKNVNLKNYQVADFADTARVLETKIVLQPNEYFVFADDSSFIKIHPTVKNVVVAKLPNLNNNKDRIMLLDSLNRIIDSLFYRNLWGGGSGTSLERMLASNSSTDSTNWKTSADTNLSTPGKRNSVTPFKNDLVIISISTSPENPTLGDEVYVKVKIKNVGLNTANNYSVTIKYETDNSLLILDKMALNHLSKNDTIVVVSQKSFTITDSVKIFAELNYSLDNNLINNKMDRTVHSGAKRKTIVINEFMTNPTTGGAEWIEFYNNSQKQINISNWFISDLYPTPKPHKISETPIFIAPNTFFVITTDTSKYNFTSVVPTEVKFGTLGNIEDGIILYDFNKRTVDSLKYDKDWQIEKGRSLERISFTDSSTNIRNWLPSLSTIGGTPGKSNSIIKTSPAEKSSIIINEILFDPAQINSEFVELFNPTTDSIDIGGWELIINGKDYFEIASTFLKLKPKGYYVIASDTSFIDYYNFHDSTNYTILKSTSLSLSNMGESTIIVDHWGNVIDSLFYTPKWHNQNIATTKNKSLERISSRIETNEASNWSTSVDITGATPGKANSVFTRNTSEKLGISFSPNPFSPNNDGFEDFSIINYSLPYNASQIRIKIFDDHGRLVRTLVNNKSVSSSGAIIFDGLDDNGNPLRIGMYIVYLEAVNIDSNQTISYKDVIVVARKF